MPIELVIDTRENHLIDLLRTNEVPITVEQLDLGDILFREDGETVVLIERKTIPDLKASICDGRGREQKARLLGSGISLNRVTYLIEGNLDKPLNTKVAGLPVSTLVGSLVNTQFRDNIKVYKTSSLAETAQYICKLLDKLEKDGDKYFKESTGRVSSAEYSASLKKQKKANMTPAVWLIAQLSLIPQVTEKVAEQIAGRYPSVSVLMTEYERTPEHLRDRLLSDIIITLKTGKTRRIGDKMSGRIHDFLYGLVKE